MALARRRRAGDEAGATTNTTQKGKEREMGTSKWRLYISATKKKIRFTVDGCGALVAVLLLAGCALDVTEAAASAGCVSQNSVNNACELDGITVTATPTHDWPDDDSDDNDSREDEGDRDDEDEELPGGGRPRSTACGDARDALVTEYLQRNFTDIADKCTDFYFVSSEFNRAEDNDHVPWGLQDGFVASVLEGVRAEYYEMHGATIRVSSGYRSPARNEALPGASRRSYHIFGKAIDMYGNWARGAGSAEARVEFEKLRNLFPEGICKSRWNAYKDRHLHVRPKDTPCSSGSGDGRRRVAVADASGQDVPSRAEQAALARDLRSENAERMMEAVYRLYDVPVEEWHSDFRRAVADVYVREEKRDFEQRVISGDRLVTLGDMVYMMGHAGDPVVIPALLLAPNPGATKALYGFGEPGFRAVLNMMLSSSPGQFADHPGRGVTSSQYLGGLDVLTMFVHNDGVDAFDRLTQSQLENVALRTLESARTGWLLVAAMPLAVAFDDGVAMVESLTDTAEIRARGITRPELPVGWIAQKAREALSSGRMR